MKLFIRVRSHSPASIATRNFQQNKDWKPMKNQKCIRGPPHQSYHQAYHQAYHQTILNPRRLLDICLKRVFLTHSYICLYCLFRWISRWLKTNQDSLFWFLVFSKQEEIASSFFKLGQQKSKQRKLSLRQPFVDSSKPVIIGYPV